MTFRPLSSWREMTKSDRFVSSAVVAILLLLAIIFFGLTLALGIAGVVIATQDNVCQSDKSVGEGCIPVDEEDLAAGVNLTVLDMSLPEVVESLDSSEEYFYWLIGATLSGLILFCFGGSLCVWIAAQVMLRINMKENKKKGLLEIETTEMATSNLGCAYHCSETDLSFREHLFLPPNKEMWMEIKGIETPPKNPQKWKEYKEGKGKEVIRVEDGLYELVYEYNDGLYLKKLGAGALVSLSFSFFCGILSILCLFWSFALGFNHSRRFEQSVTPFVVANVLSGIVAPVLFFVSAFILMNIVDYFTRHKIEAHLILTWFLPGLKYEVGRYVKGKDRHQWVIADSLVLETNDHESANCILPQRVCDKYFNFCKSCLPNPFTILLSIIIVLSLMISFSYFIDITLVNQVTVSSCSDPNINIQYSCFRAGTLGPVNCMSNNATQTLHCFRFFRFGIDVDLITASSSAFAFYLLTARIFAGMIWVIKMLRHFTFQHGVIFIAGGFLLMLVTGIIGIMWISGYASESVSLLAHLDVLNLAQLTMVSLFIMIVGFLSHQGEWMEKRPAKHKLVKFKNQPDYN